jgi:hypothetical protein
MAVSKRLKFEILRRDGHKCRYCGVPAADARLTVDHVIPVALGGSDEPSNLAAACGDCNGGKTSSSPDAPVVADVAKDALRWSRAMEAAAGEMLARASGTVDAHAHFEKVWARYGSGPKRVPLPKDPGWQNTVDSFLKSGLPMTVLEECIEIAMGQRRVPAENVFRYMCGVAWRKVQELRERASELVRDESSDADEGDERDDLDVEAIANWCRIILKQCDADDVEKATRDCRNRAGDESPSGILWFVIHNMELDRMSLYATLRELLEQLPDEIGIDLIREQEAQWLDRLGPSGRYASLVQAADETAYHFSLVRARKELAEMPADEAEAWVQRARDENADIAEHLDEDYYRVEGARLAREALTAQSTGVEV